MQKRLQSYPTTSVSKSPQDLARGYLSSLRWLSTADPKGIFFFLKDNSDSSTQLKFCNNYIEQLPKSKCLNAKSYGRVQPRNETCQLLWRYVLTQTMCISSTAPAKTMSLTSRKSSLSVSQHTIRLNLKLEITSKNLQIGYQAALLTFYYQ